MIDSDKELIDSYISSSDGDSIKKLIEKYTPQIYNFVRRLVGVGEAEDITQDVFIKAWKNLHKFSQEKASFKTWIFAIAKNTTTDFLRKKKSLVFSDLENAEEDFSFSETIPDENLLPDEVLQKLQDSLLLNEILEKLPENYRTILILHYQEEMTFDEISQILDKPLNTVKSHHHRAILELRKMIV